MLIGLMSLPNQIVYIQFHPVAYIVKLKIEMSMASLITRLAKDQDTSFNANSLSYSHDHNAHQSRNHSSKNPDIGLKSFHKTNIQAVLSDVGPKGTEDNTPGIHRRVDVDVRVDVPAPRPESSKGGPEEEGLSGQSFDRGGDELSLTKNVGHPTRGG
jgi:hypothetical protein